MFFVEEGGPDREREREMKRIGTTVRGKEREIHRVREQEREFKGGVDADILSLLLLSYCLSCPLSQFAISLFAGSSVDIVSVGFGDTP